MPRAHFICKGGLNLRAVRFPQFDSGFWDISEADAARLVGGTLHLHETKTERSYFGGDITGYRIEERPEEAHVRRIVFQVTSTATGRGARWSGANHALAWYSGVVED
jgi:hypothetical protein